MYVYVGMYQCSGSSTFFTGPDPRIRFFTHPTARYILYTPFRTVKQILLVTKGRKYLCARLHIIILINSVEDKEGSGARSEKPKSNGSERIRVWNADMYICRG
jgi:hypothetical protein